MFISLFYLSLLPAFSRVSHSFLFCLCALLFLSISFLFFLLFVSSLYHIFYDSFIVVILGALFIPLYCPLKSSCLCICTHKKTGSAERWFFKFWFLFFSSFAPFVLLPTFSAFTCWSLPALGQRFNYEHINLIYCVQFGTLTLCWRLRGWMFGTIWLGLKVIERFSQQRCSGRWDSYRYAGAWQLTCVMPQSRILVFLWWILELK